MNGVAATQPTITTTIETAKIVKPIQLLSSLDAYMWLALRSRPVVKTIRHVDHDERQEPDQHEKSAASGQFECSILC